MTIVDENHPAYLGVYPDLLPGLPTPAHPLLQQFMDYWLTLKGDRAMPVKSEIDPAAIKHCLPYVWLYEFVPEDDTFRCILAGEDIRKAWAQPVVGKSITELFGPNEAVALTKRWQIAMEAPAILHSLTDVNAHHKRAERLSLPLSNAAGNPTHIFGMSIYRFDRISDFDKPAAPINPKTRYYAQPPTMPGTSPTL